MAVDASSTDGSLRLLRDHIPRVVTTSAGAGFLDAVRAGLAAVDGERLVPSPDPQAPVPREHERSQDWVWLLHDDSAPAPDALARLLDAVERSPSVGVAGCKERTWDDPNGLLRTGFTTSRAGRPISGVDAGEVDQGQTDVREDVLAVGTAGMLLRRDVWEALGGGDAALPVLGDDVDLCRRARLAGHRVVVVPSAVVAHADATRSGRRDTAVVRRSLRWTERRHAVHARLVASPALLLPVTVVAVLAGGVARAVVGIALKRPGRALGDLSAALAAVARPDLVWRARRLAARSRTVPRSALTPLLAPRREVGRWHRDRWQRRRRAPAGVPVRQAPRTGAALPAAVVLLLAAASVLALHRLLVPGAASGGALAAAPDTLGELWESARSSWVSGGVGAPGPVDPFLTVLAALTLPFGGRPALAVTGLLLLAVPAAGLGAWVAAGAAIVSRWWRAWAAVAWASGPPLLLAVDDGRLGPLVAHVVLPWAVLGVVRTLRASTGRRAAAAAAAAGLAFAAVVAASPVLLPAGLAALVVAAVAGRSFRRAAMLVLTALPALAVLGPLLPVALDEPRLLLADPGRPAMWEPVPAWQLPLVASGTVLLLAALALLRAGGRGGRARTVRAGWAVSLVGLAAAGVSSRALLAVEPSGGVRGWAGSGASLLLAGLLTAVLAGAGGARGGGPRPIWQRLLGGVVAALALVGPATGLAAWTWRQADDGGTVTAAGGSRLPVVAADAAASADRARTLVLRADEATATVTLARTDGDRIGATSAAVELRRLRHGTAGDGPAGRALAEAVAVLAAGHEDPRPRLADLGVGYVLLLGTPGPGSALTADGLDAVVGLARSGEVPHGVLWRVMPDAGPLAPDRGARARIVGADGGAEGVVPSGPVDVRAAVPAGESGRRLVLAERADDGWHATMDGAPLPPAVHAGWAQAFELPAAGGRVVVEHRPAGGTPWQPVQVAVFGLTVLLALPVGGAAPRRGRAR